MQEKQPTAPQDTTDVEATTETEAETEKTPEELRAEKLMRNKLDQRRRRPSRVFWRSTVQGTYVDRTRAQRKYERLWRRALQQDPVPAPTSEAEAQWRSRRAA